ncbi:hypothetical protein [Nocardioides sp.]|uniref:hypothetical protein n=1 Tax=Nocardioides sp. TaxID=35761 RepID=UPI0037836D1F
MERITRRARRGICAAVVILLSLGLASLVEPAVAGSSSLTVTPGSYVGGQLVTFTGRMGVPGKRAIHLQYNMGHSWNDVEGFTRYTAADGSFSLTYPAPSMFNIKMRVVSGSLATPAWNFVAKSQEVSVSLLLDPPLDVLGEHQVVAGLPFTLVADAAPSLKAHPDLPPPVIVGRTLTLQRRLADGTWTNAGATTLTNKLGVGLFVVTVPPGGPDEVTYRVREENWTAGGNKIGWFPSFPFTVQVLDAIPRLPGLTPRAAGSTSVPTSAASLAAADRHARYVLADTASKAWGWGMSNWDFAWEYGESLSSRPSRGLKPVGSWTDGSTGSGRAAKHNGGLTLDSGPNPTGPGDVGDTFATMQGNPATYGRWEVRYRARRYETGAGNFHAVFELVPARASDYHCGAQNITLADIPVYGPNFTVGAKSRSGHQWSLTRNTAFGDKPQSLAVEVAKSHITWFLNAKPFATVKTPAAISAVPKTLRLTLVGDGDKEMNHTQFISDWQRGWSLAKGKQVMKGTVLRAKSFTPAC